ncbi:prepilin-type N-terminal cleavage/methylation domain-containing protein [Vibrio cholerae]|uniref:prepilin-type N-terminal cleavage/methylation domain-containing protein n=1 Tax=Vibrio cholerae TaxID=666 RepID=UPI0002C1653D|nr:prepilin-type N-terminal cleavage/methylation domain-containing protein [Vibrio cholerae]EJL3955319.1 prepilin-type N-terminal cleavage/methylation domain-containing protein [Vibrio cholerae]EJL6292742.1 prepilin-type N-terminal cleavage/methylation domain-containing protein [Vibrio cholerae]EMQ54167.1 putative prepilin-type N-cleavage/methylation domain protein [Vibrio cholerae O1 str. EM-1676A]GHY11079.1 pilus assembly protein PilW [Vibrio cholerae]GIB34890.1 pilus assembly protein PilW [
MALKSANQQGNTLIEFMVAALVGAMALAIVGTVFLSNQKAAAQRSKEIMLLQQMSSVMQQMKEDIQRAGFDGIATNSMMLSGSANILYQQANKIGYVYRKTASESSNTVYQLNNNMLEYCQKDSPSPLNIVSAATECFDLFDPKQIKVTQFDVHRTVLSGSEVESAFISISMAAELKNDHSISHAMSLQVQQRNWQ